MVIPIQINIPFNGHGMIGVLVFHPDFKIMLFKGILAGDKAFETKILIGTCRRFALLIRVHPESITSIKTRHSKKRSILFKPITLRTFSLNAY